MVRKFQFFYYVILCAARSTAFPSILLQLSYFVVPVHCPFTDKFRRNEKQFLFAMLEMVSRHCHGFYFYNLVEREDSNTLNFIWYILSDDMLLVGICQRELMEALCQTWAMTHGGSQLKMKRILATADHQYSELFAWSMN